MKKIIFNLNIKEIKKCTLHFMNEVYIIVFKLNNESTRGFRISKECGKIACSLYDLFEEMLDAKTLRSVKTIIKKQSSTLSISNSNINAINTNNTLRSGNINLDFSGQNVKSNYDNTIPNNGSVFNANSIQESEYSDAQSNIQGNEDKDDKMFMDKID